MAFDPYKDEKVEAVIAKIKNGEAVDDNELWLLHRYFDAAPDGDKRKGCS